MGTVADLEAVRVPAAPHFSDDFDTDCEKRVEYKGHVGVAVGVAT